MAQEFLYRNLAEVVAVQATALRDRPALRFRDRGSFKDLSWQEYAHLAASCAAGLLEAGVGPGDRVGLLSENRPEWLIADLGILAAAAVTVPFHASLAQAQLQEQLADAGVSCLFVSTRRQWQRLCPFRPDLPGLKTIVVFDPFLAAGGSMSWENFLQMGRLALATKEDQLQQRRRLLHTDSLATILYTSGTTGHPKGVMLTHGNLLSNAQAFLAALPISPDAVRLNWLPFSHVFARTVDHYVSLLAGATLCLAESPNTLLADLAEIQPTHLTGVPRFYERVLAQAAGATVAETSRRLRDFFGPRIIWLKTGGAPLPPAVFDAYQQAGLLLLQGYGLTETSPDIATNRPGQNKVGTVGLALPGVEVKIAPDGEILTRGPHVMQGYWNNPPATAEVLRQGWLHTGDLGCLDDEGYLHITGRKKEVIVLSTGKKVMPAAIENLLLADPVIDQAMVCGEGRPYLAALIVPHWDNLRQTLAAKGISLNGEADENTAEDPRVRHFLARRIKLALADVSPWERIKKFLVLPQPFSHTKGELTVSLKLRRQGILAKYQGRLNKLYQERGVRGQESGVRSQGSGVRS